MKLFVRYYQILNATILIAACVSCTVKDSKKCVDGYFYDTKLDVCMPEEIDGTDSEDGGDGGYSTDDCPPQSEFSGLDVECDDDTKEVCEGLDANFCLIDPATKSGGCVITDCHESECPCGYSCCDCNVIGYPIFCVPYGNAVEQLEDYYCKCD